MNDPLSRNEFLTHMGTLQRGIHGVHERLDRQDARLRATETAVAVLRDRSHEARTSGARWGAGVGVVIAAMTEGLWHWFDWR
jgi:hypothetical protein